VVTTHEVIHSVHQSKQQGFILQVNYEKAHDKVNWNFLLDILEKRGFGKRWIMWMKMILFRGFVGVTINNMEGEFFQTGKGLRQGGPLFPILFNLVVDILSRMLYKTVEAGLIKCLGNDLIQGGVISMQYANDTILFVD
jgi:retron-type reverse transcriptase